MKVNNPFDTSIKYQFVNKIKGITPIKNHVIVTDMNFGERQLSSGLVLLGDDAKSSGIRPRWAKVYAVGPEQQDVVPEQWILIEHGRWTRGIKVEINLYEVLGSSVDLSLKTIGSGPSSLQTRTSGGSLSSNRCSMPLFYTM
jgi:hypothetical protein